MRKKSFLRRFFEPEYLLGKEKWAGEKCSANEIYKTLFKVAWPATAETVLVSMMSFVDTVMVSTIGAYAVAATGLSNQPRMLFFAVFFALNAGVTAIVSRRRGQDDMRGANRCLAQAFTLCLVLSILLCGIAVAVARPMLIFTGAADDTVEAGVEYFRITIVGMAFVSLGMVINAAQRGVGNTKISMRTNLTANVVNVVFNYLLINGIGFFPRLEVKGAAIATLMGNVVSFPCPFIPSQELTAFAHRVERLLVFDKKNLRFFLKSAVPRHGTIVYKNRLFRLYKIVASLGTVAFATHQILYDHNKLLFSLGEGLGISAASLVGQSLGRKRPDVAVIYGRAAQRVGLLVSFALVLLFSFAGRPLMMMFTREEEIVLMGIQLLYITAAVSPAQVTQLIFSGSLRGAGDTKYVAYTSLISIGLVRPLTTYILCYPLGLGLIGGWISLLIDQYMRTVFATVRFSKGKWTKIKI